MVIGSLRSLCKSSWTVDMSLGHSCTLIGLFEEIKVASIESTGNYEPIKRTIKFSINDVLICLLRSNRR